MHQRLPWGRSLACVGDGQPQIVEHIGPRCPTRRAAWPFVDSGPDPRSLRKEPGRMYPWWVFVHLVGVFGFLLSHGVSVMVTFRLRKERDPGRITHLLEVSGTSIKGFYWSLAVLLVGGVAAGFLGHWWGQGWIWAAIATLVIVSLAMYVMARPYYRRVGLVARAMAGGSQAVTDAQLDQILRGSRPNTFAALGMVGL